MPLRPARKRGGRPASKARDGIAAPYAAYAVTSDGTRRPIDDALKIVVDLGSTELEIALTIPHPVLSGQIGVAVEDGRILAVGHGDGGSVYVGSIVPREMPWKPR
jgi:hypothetical protein